MSNTVTGEELAHDLSPLIKVYKDGRVERLWKTVTVPPSLDTATGVASVDVVICPETGLSARLYAPTQPAPAPDHQKLRPLLVYFHGGAFVIESAASQGYHGYLTAVSARADAVVLSVDYRLAPEHPLPAAYEDAMTALRWIASPATSDAWLIPRSADRSRVFLAGDSAGANIAHRTAVQVGAEGGLQGVDIRGMALVHPYFWGEEAIEDEAAPEKAGTKAMIEGLWRCVRPGGLDDPWFNPEKDPELARVACGRVVVFVAEKDGLRHRGVRYGEALRRSAWGGRVEVVEDKGMDHVFHLFDPTTEKADQMMGKICSFINGQDGVV